MREMIITLSARRPVKRSTDKATVKFKTEPGTNWGADVDVPGQIKSTRLTFLQHTRADWILHVFVSHAWLLHPKRRARTVFWNSVLFHFGMGSNFSGEVDLNRRCLDEHCFRFLWWFVRRRLWLFGTFETANKSTTTTQICFKKTHLKYHLLRVRFGDVSRQ